MKNKTSCPICENSNTEAYEAMFCDFIADRVFDGKNQQFNIIKCPECGFSYFEYRLSEEETKKLYSNYRDDNYQKQRQKHECWYTKEINDQIGKNPTEIKSRNANLTNILEKNIDTSKIKSVLDFGGDKGQFIPEIFANSKKFVYDISGIETVEDTTALTSLEDCKKNNYDLVLCSHVLEHVTNPNEILDDIKSLMKKEQYLYVELPFDSPFYKKPFSNLQFLLNKYYNWGNLIKHFINSKKHGNKHLMNEHINYFTPESINILLKNKGFKILSNEVKTINAGWIKTKIICVLGILE